MKKNVSGQSKRKSGKSNGLSLEKKLLTYSVAAGAVLALTPSADARIHSGPSNCVVQSKTDCLVDFGGAAAAPFKFYATGFCSPLSSLHVNEIVLQVGNFSTQAVLSVHNYGKIKNLQPPYVVNASATNFNIGGLLNSSAYPAKCEDAKMVRSRRLKAKLGSVAQGTFNNSSGYIGVKFDIPGNSCNPVYGWIHYDAVGRGGKSGNVIDWAYEDNCAPIRVGQDHAIPTFTEFGLFLFAALILLVGTRRLRQSADG